MRRLNAKQNGKFTDGQKNQAAKPKLNKASKNAKQSGKRRKFKQKTRDKKRRKFNKKQDKKAVKFKLEG